RAPVAHTLTHWIFEGHFLGHFLVDDDGGSIGFQFLIKISSFYQLHAQCAEVIFIGSPVLAIHGFVDFVSAFFPIAVVVAVGAVHRQVIIAGTIFYIGQLLQFIFKFFMQVAQRIRSLDHDHMIFVKTEFGVQDKIHLLVDDECADNQNDRSSELKDDHRAAHARAFASTAHTSFKYVYGFKRGEVEGRIDSSEDTNYKRPQRK